MSLTRIGSIGINTGIAFAGVTTIVTLNTANDALSIGATVNVGSGITLGASGDIFATGVSTVTTLKVGSGVTVSSDGDIFATGVVTATTFSGAFSGDGSSLTGVANTDVIFPDKISFGDGTATSGGQINIGVGSDLKLYHNGSHSHIDNNTGNLMLSSASHIDLLNPANDEYLARFQVDGSAELYENGAKKLETTSSGVNVTGVTVDDGATHDGDVTFTSENGNNIVFDKSDNDLTFGDQVKARFGADNDLSIEHDGSNSYISDGGTGDLVISGSVVRLKSSNTAEDMIKATEDGAVELYHDNTKRFETTSSGVEVFGELQMDDANSHIKLIDGARIDIGTGGDLRIYHSSTQNFIRGNATASPLYIDCCENVHIRHIDTDGSNAETMIKAVGDGNVELYSNNVKRFQTRSGGGAADGIVVYGNSNNSAINLFTDSTIRGTVYANSSDMIGFLDEGGDWAIKHTNNTSTEFYVSTQLRAMIDSDGLKFHGDTATANALDDYEEGEYTPTISTGSGSVSLRSSYDRVRYTKIGRQVSVTGQLVFNAHNSAGGTLNISLPFANGNGNDRAEYVFYASCGYFNTSGSSSPSNNVVSIGFYLSANTTSATVYGLNDDYDSTTANWVGDGSDIWFNLTYFTDA